MSLKITQNLRAFSVFLLSFVVSAFSFDVAVAQDCEDGTNAVDMVLLSPGWEDGAYGMVYTISLDGEVVSTGSGTAGSWASDTTSLCLIDGCYEVSVSDADCCNYGYGWSFMGASGEAGTGATVSVGENGCVTGCTDELADNYNSAADISDITLCQYSVVPGCMDMTACNYNADAGQDDGSCEYPAEGFDCDGNCLEGTFTSINVEEAIVYSFATYTYTLVGYGGSWSLTDFSTGLSAGSTSTDDFSGCLVDGCYEISGISGSGGYSFAYTLNGGDMVIPGNANETGTDFISIGESGCAAFTGCTDPLADNYSEAYVISDNTLCEYSVVPGCTDMAACNYNADAGQDDGTCEYPAEGFDCDGNCLEGVSAPFSMESLYYGDGFYGATYTITNASTGDTVADGPSDTGNWTYSTDDYCMPVGCYEVNVTSNGWDSYDYNWYFGDASGPTGSSGFANIGGEDLCPSGCTDPLANNFDVDAIVDDGSCVVCVDGVEVSSSVLSDGELPDDVVTVTINTGFIEGQTAYSNEIHWELYNNGNDLIMYGGNALTVGNTDNGGVTGGDYEDGEVYQKTSGCLPDGCYKLITYDTWGDGWNGNGSFTVTNQFNSILVPTTIMGVNEGFDEDGQGYNTYPQQLATYFSIGDASCETYGCVDSLASNYDSNATVDDESCIFCDENSVDVTFSFNQENITSDEVYVYNQETNDTVFSVFPGELSTWGGKDTLTCVPVGCYVISMGSASSQGWTDGSALQVLDDLTSNFYLLDVDAGSLDITVVSFGGASCIDDQIGGCTDSTFDNYDPNATYDNGSCAYTCDNAVASFDASVEQDASTSVWSYACADADGNGAEVTFNETTSFADVSYIVGDCDSASTNLFLPSSTSIYLEPGQCIYFQALDTWNTDSVGTVTANFFAIPDSSEWGCMDDFACNYDSTANYDFGCVFPEAGVDCDGNLLGGLDCSASIEAFEGSNYASIGATSGSGNDFAWFYFVVPDADGSLSVTSCDLTTFDTGAGLFEDCDDWTGSIYDGLDGNDDACGLQTTVTADVSGMDTVYIVWRDQYMSSGGQFEFNVSFTEFIYGCSDELANNYDETVTVNVDSLCQYTYGCMDSLALNYNVDAVFDDGSCEFDFVYGCVDTLACNFTDTADVDDGSCTYPVEGFDCDGLCLEAGNVVETFTVNANSAWGLFGATYYVTNSDGDTVMTGSPTNTTFYQDSTCLVPGCYDVEVTFADCCDNSGLWSWTFGGITGPTGSSFSNISIGDGCASGCMDSLACNFDATALVDNGTCEYPAEGLDCDGNCLSGDTYVLTLGDDYGDGWNGGFLTIDGIDYEQANSQAGTVQYEEEYFTLCLDASECYDVIYTSGSWSSENSWSISDLSGNVLVSAGPASGQFGDCGVYGCMDPDATNYNIDATIEDGTCTYPISMAVELDFTHSSGICGYANDYDESNTAYDPVGTSYMGNDDMAYFFTAENGEVEVSMTQGEDGTAQPGVFVFDGDPLAEGTSLIVSETGFSGGDVSLTFESSDTATYYVVLDATATYGCLTSFDLTITQIYSGCTDSLATNYDPDATDDDGSCFYDFVYGCTDELACNYVDTADVDDGSCFYPASDFVDCDGNCLYNTVTVSLSESYGDGTEASISMNGDVVVGPGVGTNTACIDLLGCVSFTYNSNGEIYTDEDSWSVSIDSVVVVQVDEGDYAWNYDGSFVADTIQYGASCPIAACTDMLACNYDSLATIDDGSCSYAEAGYDCDGLCLVDTDEDGICDEFEIAGCTDSYATNYDPSATDDDGSCEACEDNSVTLVMNDLYGDGWNGATFTMTNSNNASLSASLYPTDSLSIEQLCVPAGCYEVTVGGGAFDPEITFSLGDYLTDVQAGTYVDIAIGGAICNPMVVDFSVDMSSVAQPNMIDYDNVVINGSWNAWQGWGLTLSDDDGDNVWTGTGEFDPAIGQFEYVVAVTGPTDGYSGWGMQWGHCDGGNFIVIFEDEVSSYSATPDLDCPEPISTTFNVDMNCVTEPYNTVHITGPIWNWTADIVMTDDDGDGIYSITFDDLSGDVEYKYMIDYWAGQEDLVDDMVDGATCAPVTDYSSYANRVVAAGSNTADTYGSCSECVEEVLGCTDASADNYDPNANTDDGSCTYCNAFEVVIISSSDASAAGSSDGSVQATGDGGSNDYSVSVTDVNGVPQNSFALAAGDYTVTVTDVVSGCEASASVTISEPTVGEDPCDIVPTGLFVDDIIHNRVVFNWSAPSAAPSHYMIRYRVVGTSSWTVMTAGPVNSNEFTGTSRTRYFMEPGTTYEWNIRARVLNEDGSTNCQSAWSASNEYTTLDACANLENLSVSTEAVWATLSADAPAAEWGVWQSKGKMRVVGTNSFRYVNGDENGNISSLKGNFTPSTDYEWHTKAWCTGNVDSEGNSDPMYHSGWGDFSSFTTEAPCDKMPTNLSTSANGAQTAITMSWDTPESGEPDHYFLELTNVTTGQVWAWNNISGSDNSKTKFGLTAGDYSWRIRGACGTNGTSWATIFSQPVTYTLGGARLENSSVANLDVYPNPSRDIFNVTFTSEEAQTMTVKVVNMIGEEIFTEELTEFVGQYTQVIDMNTQPKGVYFLEITTSTGGINKKIVLQ